MASHSLGKDFFKEIKTMKQSESITKLLSGLMDVQREIPTMPKNNPDIYDTDKHP